MKRPKVELLIVGLDRVAVSFSRFLFEKALSNLQNCEMAKTDSQIALEVIVINGVYYF